MAQLFVSARTLLALDFGRMIYPQDWRSLSRPRSLFGGDGMTITTAHAELGCHERPPPPIYTAGSLVNSQYGRDMYCTPLPCSHASAFSRLSTYRISRKLIRRNGLSATSDTVRPSSSTRSFSWLLASFFSTNDIQNECYVRTSRHTRYPAPARAKTAMYCTSTTSNFHPRQPTDDFSFYFIFHGLGVLILTKDSFSSRGLHLSACLTSSPLCWSLLSSPFY